MYTQAVAIGREMPLPAAAWAGGFWATAGSAATSRIPRDICSRCWVFTTVLLLRCGTLLLPLLATHAGCDRWPERRFTCLVEETSQKSQAVLSRIELGRTAGGAGVSVTRCLVVSFPYGNAGGAVGRVRSSPSRGAGRRVLP